ncbi:MAG: hypothetical protein ACOYJF_07340 [Prevotella sp.]|jgi:hypothetical protein
MKLYNLLQAYDFDELMPVIVDMFPGTGKFRKQLSAAYNMLMTLKPVPSKKSIRYQVIHVPDSNESYIGAVDKDFDATWEVCLGKEVSREKGVNLSDIELAANCLVNVALTGRHPRSFDDDYAILIQPD